MIATLNEPRRNTMTRALTFARAFRFCPFFFKAFKNSFDQGLASEIGPSPGELIVLVINLSIALGASHKKMDASNSAFSTSMFNIDRSILRRDIKGLNVKFHAPFTFIFQPSIVSRSRVQISRKNDVD